jgi:hypothetical protein
MLLVCTGYSILYSEIAVTSQNIDLSSRDTKMSIILFKDYSLKFFLNSVIFTFFFAYNIHN